MAGARSHIYFSVPWALFIDFSATTVAPWCHWPTCVTTIVHSTVVSTSNIDGESTVEPSGARSLCRSFSRRRSLVPGFPRHIVSQTSSDCSPRWWIPRKKSRFMKIVSMLLRRSFLKGFAYSIAWSARYRQNTSVVCRLELGVKFLTDNPLRIFVQRRFFNGSANWPFSGNDVLCSSNIFRTCSLKKFPRELYQLDRECELGAFFDNTVSMSNLTRLLMLLVGFLDPQRLEGCPLQDP